MDSHRKNSKQMLEKALDAVLNTEPDKTEIENGSARVWARIGRELKLEDSGASPVEQIRACADYRALIPGYIAGALSPARAMLFKDHTNECVACRKALNTARGTEPGPAAIPAKRRFNRTVAVMAVAATLILGVALQQAGYLNFLLPVAEVQATARTIDGQLYRIADLSLTPMLAGEALKTGEPIRTAAGSGAVIELADGTHIEMRERSQLSLTGTYDGIRVNLTRGSVIVEAARQRNGHLYVSTDDINVSVVGTVFAVSSGVKGSRVSVIEGEVHVSQSSAEEKALHPGDQMSTSPSLTAVSIEEEISWSRNLDTHLALLRTLADVNAFLRGRVPGPQLRFTSTLLPLVPVNTVVYGAFPNVSSALGQAYDLFRLKIDQNPALRTWWGELNERPTSADPTLEEMIQHVRTLAGYLGEEVVIAVTGSTSGPADVIVLANTQNSAAMLTELRNMLARASDENPIRVLTNPAELATFTGAEQGPVAYLNGSLLALATSPQAIYNVIVAQQSGNNRFASQPFYASIAQAYSKGAATLFAADIATMLASSQSSGEATALGLTRVDRLVFEQKQVAGKTTTQAQLSFNGERSGVASWLAAPAPMGALEFVSSQAYGVASVVTKDAVAILEEILSLGGDFQDGASELEKFQQETGIDVRRDLAEPLGGEFLLAIDGPFLPTPSWKAIAEVYNSARLQNTISWLVTQVNNRATQEGGSGVTLSAESVNGQTYYTLRPTIAAAGPEVHYTYALGYIIVAPSRGLVSQALQYQQSRSSIVNAATFRAMMPADGGDHCSAILYQNLAAAATSIANYVPAGVGGVTSEQLQVLRQTIDLTPATLVCAAGEPNRIVMGYQGDLGFNVLMLGGLRSMLETVVPGHADRENPDGNTN